VAVKAGRITLVVAVLLLFVALLSAAGTRDAGPAVPGAEKDATGTPAPVVEDQLPAARPIRAGLGDVVRLRVRADTPDEARIVRLALEWPVGPGLPGATTFVAERAGRFAVTLRSGKRIGTLVVEAAG
jgi:hypothetical protein